MTAVLQVVCGLNVIMSSVLSLDCLPAVTPVTAVAFVKDWMLFGTFSSVEYIDIGTLLKSCYSVTSVVVIECWSYLIQHSSIDSVGGIWGTTGWAGLKILVGWVTKHLAPPTVIGLYVC